jgi:hypothetical protein
MSTLRALPKLGVFLAAAILAACGGSTDGPGLQPSTGAPGEPILANSPPLVVGKPETTAEVDTPWSFAPRAMDPDDDVLTFSVDNPPPWTEFDPATGRLEGTPTEADIGTWENIVLTVSDGTTAVRVPAFFIEVHAREGAVGSATLSWHPPTERVDGSPIGQLAGYRVLYGKISQHYDRVAEIDNPSITRYVVDSLTPGEWYFAVTAVAADGLESAPSAEVSTNIGS